jgi:hypothetical protein
VTSVIEPGKVRFNEKLDHLQARRPFVYNLVTGALIAVPFALLFGVHWALVAVYVLSWATLRWFLWGDGRILRRQYEARLVRVDAERAEKRRQR